MTYIRPIPLHDVARPTDAVVLAGGWCRFTHLEILERGRAPVVVPASEASPSLLSPLMAPRADFAGLAMDSPRLMGILNVTPDSFSDGGLFLKPEAAMMQARAMAAQADILDVGGESTRPGAAEVTADEETARTAPVIAAMRAAGIDRAVSIDTRKAAVAQAALNAGAGIVNDVTALQFDPAMAGLVADAGVPVILMHSLATPATMQDNPVYEDVLLDVYDALAARVAMAEAAGIDRRRIAIDPGIGFGKTLAHNLALLARLSLFHSLGLPLLLGASRKRFIGTLTGEDEAARRMPGSIAVALAGVAQGVQMIRVHDVRDTRAALTLWQAATQHEEKGENP
ncbi:MAG: dihydropteroate synthase [Pseudotabrizicola sp.]|uniref:dihydropteroate synthase n=1 Tax=Pseudotabrizicola sp. TaxID=2939647 RepID=UPI00273039AF|nr:dihydropteroate synthase [Pseudotabrizicola sp.]MDP2083464.1 dihydropteroate synthase [Pseudotabrizicola sp.]MDZ7572849.1 dihydropteroate synthase [Pseudotabrizicola sp.]